MRKILKLLIATLCLLPIVISCEKEQDAETSIVSIKGVVQKGPFVAGSTVTVTELNQDLSPTGRTFTASILNDKGEFEVNRAELSSNYVKLTVNGFFFNEVTGNLSFSPITLHALSKVTENANTLNVNILTHLEKSRVENLIQSGMSFEDAKSQALSEVLNAFHITDEVESSEQMDLVSGQKESSILLAISSILLANKTEAELTEYLAKFSNDISTDGVLTNSDLKETLVLSTKALQYSVEHIKRNIEAKYASLNVSVSADEFSSYLDYDNDGLVGSEDIDNVDNIDFGNIQNAEVANQLYFSNEVTLDNITGNVSLSVRQINPENEDDAPLFYSSRTVSETLVANRMGWVVIDQEMTANAEGTYLVTGEHITSTSELVADNNVTYNYATFYLYVNGVRVSDESLRSGLSVQKGDKVKIGINPVHHHLAIEGPIGQDLELAAREYLIKNDIFKNGRRSCEVCPECSDCYEADEVLCSEHEKSCWFPNLEGWAKGKTATAVIILNGTEKTFSVTLSSMD